jgi:hypothetical protein
VYLKCIRFDLNVYLKTHASASLVCPFKSILAPLVSSKSLLPISYHLFFSTQSWLILKIDMPLSRSQYPKCDTYPIKIVTFFLHLVTSLPVLHQRQYLLKCIAWDKELQQRKDCHDKVLKFN